MGRDVEQGDDIGFHQEVKPIALGNAGLPDLVVVLALVGAKGWMVRVGFQRAQGFVGLLPDCFRQLSVAAQETRRV